MLSWPDDFMDKVICQDAREVLPIIPGNSIDLVVTDPPYNIGKAAWDKVPDYLDWCEKWIAECSRVLKRNGAFWVSHSKPLVLAKLSEMVAGHGRGLVNWVTWDKYNGAPPGDQYVMNKTKLHPQGKRALDQDAEYLIFHADEGDWTRQCDKERGFIFEPLRAYLSSERDRAGWTTRRVAERFQEKTGSRTVTGMAGHWFERVQWVLPTAENYNWLRTLFNTNGTEYLRREYEGLRREYEGLRYTFNNPGKVSSVWQIPPAGKNGHPTPKPEALLERIIRATSNEGDVVLDPFLGSGTTAVAATKLGRHFIGIEINPDYCKIAETRLANLQPEIPFPVEV